MKRQDIFFLSLLAALWVIIIIIINPIGNFPLNDDWQYARPVWYLINKGYYFSPDQYSPIIMAQVLWGTLFCLPGGFSFTTLRISVLVLGLIGVIVFYVLLKRIAKNNFLAFMGGLILMINPFYLCTANSFMTDTPFVAIAIISIYFFYRSLQSGKHVYLFWGTVFAVICTLIRQFCIVVPLAYGIAALYKYKPKINSWYKYFIPAIITLVALKLGLLWLKYIGSELKPYGGKHVTDFLSHPNIIFQQVFERIGYIVYYPGFFLFPFILFRVKTFYLSLNNKQRMVALVFPLLFIPSLLFDWSKMPYGNIINQWSVGAVALKMPPVTNEVHSLIIHSILTGIAFPGAILLLICITSVLIKLISDFRSGHTDAESGFKYFIIASVFGYSMLLFVSDAFFDRYILFCIPLFFLLIASNWADFTIKSVSAIFIHGIFIFTIATFSILSTHDYLEWNRSRQTALTYLTDDLHISPHKIDGGYEFNGWYIGKYYPLNRGKSIWFVDDDVYVVSLSNLDGYSVMKEFPFQNYFPYETRSIYVLHRN